MVSFWPLLCLVLEPFGLLNCNDPSITELRGNTFDKFLSDNEFVMVKFYTPWCQHCKKFRSEYSQLSNMLQVVDSKIKLAKVNVDEEKRLGEQNGIRSFPTLKLFINSKPLEYRGKRTAEVINTWMARKTNPILTLETLEEIETFVDDSELSVIGFFDDLNSKHAEIFRNAMLEDDSTAQFAVVTSPEVRKEFGSEDNRLILYKQFDDKETKFEAEFTEDNLKNFFSTASKPLLIDFKLETASQTLKNSVQSHLFVFASKSEEIYKNIENELREVSRKWRDQFLVIIVNMDLTENYKVLNVFGVEPNEIPTYRIVKLDEGVTKYKPANLTLSIEAITDFMQEFVRGEVSPDLRSQELPKDWDANAVTVLVNTNFDEIVFNVEKDVLVEFYSPRCGHCKNMEKVYNQLGEHYKNSKTVVIAKIDSTLNELAHTKIRGYPTINLYKRGNNEVKEYEGSRTLDSFIAFIEESQNASKPVVNDEL